VRPGLSTLDTSEPSTRSSQTVADATSPLHPGWAPLTLPLSLLAPGTGQLLRGEQPAGRRMLLASGGFLTLALAGAALLATTGASDISAGVGIPVAIVGVAGHGTLGLADVVGTFSNGERAFPAGVTQDVWNVRSRVG